MGYSIDIRVSQMCKTLGCTSDASQYTDAILNDTFSLAYDPPMVALVSPRNGSTEGGYEVVLNGSSFGGFGDAVVTLHTLYSGRAAPINLPIVRQLHSSLTVVMQPAAGTYLNMSVTVGGQVAMLLSVWSYNPPIIYEIQPPLTGRNWTAPPCEANATGVPCFQNWLPAPDAELIIYGANFGPDATYAAIGAVAISIGSDPCIPRNGNPSVYISNFMLSCSLLNVAVGNKSVSLSIANQTIFIPESAGLTVQCDVGYTGQAGTRVRGDGLPTIIVRCYVSLFGCNQPRVVFVIQVPSERRGVSWRRDCCDCRCRLLDCAVHQFVGGALCGVHTHLRLPWRQQVLRRVHRTTGGCTCVFPTCARDELTHYHWGRSGRSDRAWYGLRRVPHVLEGQRA